jgi:hypothetical protein
MHLGAWVYRSILVGTTVSLVTGCDGTGQVGQEASTDTTGSTAQTEEAASSAPYFLECATPAPADRADTVTVPPQGGPVWISDATGNGGSGLLLPPGAVLQPVEFVITDVKQPNGFVWLSFQANGAEEYQFETPVVLAVSLDRCTSEELLKALQGQRRLKLYRVLQEAMTGVRTAAALTPMITDTLDVVQRQGMSLVVTVTDHLSGYLLGAN